MAQDDYFWGKYPYIGAFDQDEYGNPRRKRTPYDFIEFDQPAIEEEDFTPVAPPQQRSRSFMDEYRKLLQRPQGAASSAYSKFLAQGAPEWQEPGFINRFGASLSGMAAGLQDPSKGYATSSSIVRRPYEDALERYDREGNVLSKAYALEDDDYQRQIQVARSLAEQHSREVDDERQAAIAASGNWSTFTNTDGVTYRVKIMPDGTVARKEIGKTKLSPVEEILNKVAEQTALQPGQKNMATFNAGLINARQEDQQAHARGMQSNQQGFAREQQGRGFENSASSQSREFAHQELMEGLRSGNISSRQVAAANRDPGRVKEILDRNFIYIENLLAQDPSLSDVVTIDENNNVRFNKPDYRSDIAKYQKYVRAYNTYFKDIPEIAPLSMNPYQSK